MDTSPYYAVVLLRGQVTELSRRLRREAGSDEETWSRLLLLGAIDRYGDKATPGRLAASEGLRTSNLAKALKDLEARGFVTQETAADDRRKVKVALTERGRAALGEVRHRRDRWLAAAIDSALTAEERKALLAAGALLARLARWHDDETSSSTQGD